MAIKLIAMDLDGTLLDSSGRLPEENARAIRDAEARGIEIVVVTGRRFPSAQKIAGELACKVLLIATNGAVIKSIDGETHYRRLLPVATARQVLEATPEFRPAAAVIFDRPLARQVIFERVDWTNPRTASYLRAREHVAEVAPLTDCLDGEDPLEILFLGGCAEMRRTMTTLQELPIASRYTLALTEYEQRNLSMLDVLNAGVTKGAALEEWTRRRGIERDEVMALGDNWNDREMLAFAGLPIVMENAVAELKSLGWKVTLSNDACGVASAIRTYALNANGRE